MSTEPEHAGRRSANAEREAADGEQIHFVRSESVGPGVSAEDAEGMSGHESGAAKWANV